VEICKWERYSSWRSGQQRGEMRFPFKNRWRRRWWMVGCSGMHSLLSKEFAKLD
jgi:hypothetical protein